ncbi:hypothetical protein SLEP1_g23143 [Rubroshorea leprosula]|uniref:Uncharacterized protein n=1 Tax=Rubroshorea leprosula TaxID=152421 RepID=A0AAV5JBK1_9ROSI|nr:hypothetical protein SLEP1_g23143 [Rubroshorea leprosula]
MAPVAARRAHNPIEQTASTSVMQREKKIKMDKKINKTMKRLKVDIAKISKDQRSIREEQRKIREKLEEIGSQCAQLREETELIFKQKAGNQVLLILVFQIIKARQGRDFGKAASLACTLRDLIANQKGKCMLMAGPKCE